MFVRTMRSWNLYERVGLFVKLSMLLNLLVFTLTTVVWSTVPVSTKKSESQFEVFIDRIRVHCKKKNAKQNVKVL